MSQGQVCEELSGLELLGVQPFSVCWPLCISLWVGKHSRKGMETKRG